jgi:hypothetical protein
MSRGFGSCLYERRNMKEAKFVKTAIIKVELEYPFPSRYTDKKIKELMENMELPDEYRENSYEFIKIIND